MVLYFRSCIFKSCANNQNILGRPYKGNFLVSTRFRRPWPCQSYTLYTEQLRGFDGYFKRMNLLRILSAGLTLAFLCCWLAVGLVRFSCVILAFTIIRVKMNIAKTFLLLFAVFTCFAPLRCIGTLIWVYLHSVVVMSQAERCFERPRYMTVKGREGPSETVKAHLQRLIGVQVWIEGLSPPQSLIQWAAQQGNFQN